MQSPPRHPTAGDLVCVRRQRWRVLQAQADGACVVLSLAGAGPANAGVVQPFITPFDLVEPAGHQTRIVRVPPRRWRPLVRHLIASTGPVGSLHVLADASVDVMPHQLEPALALVRGDCVRVLLADDVGLGKTIEAGLILAELRARSAVTHALVLTPAGLRDQWHIELRDRFAIASEIVDASRLASTTAAFVAQPNPWHTYAVAIASVDLAKRPEHLAAILQCSWDLLIVDEAHNTVGDTDRHAAVHAIAARTPYVVLVTATPHNGDADAFGSLCGIGAHGEACAVFRRTRAEVRPGQRRRPHLLRVTPTAAERRMHDALAAFTRAVTREHTDSSGDAWLAVAVLNKRALSSAHALWRSVTRRLDVLAACDRQPVEPRLPFDDPDGEMEARDDAPAWTGGPVLVDAGRERRLLAAVARTAADAANEGESKLRVISRWLRRVDEPVIVFSEYRDTLQHVADSIRRPALQLHGGLTAIERRAVLDAFPTRVPILLATDAAGEGLNLHDRCRLVVNLELPWNPVRIEQRIGRVDRIGQTRTVHALVLVATGTPEVQVLERLRGRIARARRDASAADPLAIVTERDVERFVLRGEVPSRGESAPALHLAWPTLTAEAAAEAERVRFVRLVSKRRRHDGTSDCYLACTRHSVTRTWLRGRTLVLLEIAVEDGRGVVIDRILLPLACDAQTNATAYMSNLVGSIRQAEAVIGRCDEATALARAFAESRAARERSIVSALPVLRTAVQPGLFDRRAERAAVAIRAAADAAHHAIASRAAHAYRAAAGFTTRITARFVLRAHR